MFYRDIKGRIRKVKKSMPEYWLDIEDWPNKVAPVKMPYKYVIEMFCDFIGAGKAYSKDKWTKEAPWDYYEKACKGKRLMHPESEYLLKKLLWNLHESGEKVFYDWYKSIKKSLKQDYEEGKLYG